MKNGKEKEHQKKVGVLENTSFHFQLQKVRFRGSIQAKYVFEHLYWCCSNTCLNGSQRGVQTFERLLGSRSNTLFEHCLNVKTTPLGDDRSSLLERRGTCRASSVAALARQGARAASTRTNWPLRHTLWHPSRPHAPRQASLQARPAAAIDYRQGIPTKAQAVDAI